jgi:hypothetical protein
MLAQAGDEVVAEFVFHAAGAHTFFRKSAAAQFAKRARKTHEETPRRKILSWIIRGKGEFGIRLLTEVKVRFTCESKIFNSGGTEGTG